ncbi:MAG: L,D-transpeptidase family protein [Kiritimatiellae bacterium]|nr:L,D-transpeptidase family protein [Kiritimatiellia bacterium]
MKIGLNTTILLFVFPFTLLFAQEEPPRFVNYRSGYHDDTLALQILLDRQNLSCNCIDGCWGARTEIALMAWQLINGKEPTGIPTAEILRELGGTTNLFTTYTITEKDKGKVIPAIPTAWEEKAVLTSMAFTSLQEMMAEKGHTSLRCVQRLNPAAAWPNPPIGTQVLLPDITCTIPKKRLKADCMRISLSRMEITVFDAEGKLFALFPCSIAKDKAQRPEGELSVKNVAIDPTYLYDPQLFFPGSAKRTKLTIPAGPNNPVGVAWVGLTRQGFGIHGTPEPELIGQAASHGCFRLANWNAAKLAKMVSIGTPMLVEE